MRKNHTKRYYKQVPGHPVQMGVTFLTFRGKHGGKIHRFQFTAIGDATRVRTLKIYQRHNQANAIKFVDYIIDTFPFCIHETRTDNGHEFQAKFHWHGDDKGIRHAYIKPGSPQLNGKVERSYLVFADRVTNRFDSPFRISVSLLDQLDSPQSVNDPHFRRQLSTATDLIAAEGEGPP